MSAKVCLILAPNVLKDGRIVYEGDVVELEENEAAELHLQGIAQLQEVVFTACCSDHSK